MAFLHAHFAIDLNVNEVFRSVQNEFRCIIFFKRLLVLD